MPNNADRATVEGFGREWVTFTQSATDLSAEERRAIFDSYFSIFPWDVLPPQSTGADIGYGSGRWAIVVGQRVGKMHAIDANAQALSVAKTNLADLANVSFHHASVSQLPLADGTLDFAYSLGVLHHVPDTAQAIRDIAAKLKPGAPFRSIFTTPSTTARPPIAHFGRSRTRRGFSSLAPYMAQMVTTTIIAAFVYWPLARMAAMLDMIGMLPGSWPLAFYRRRSFYVMRTDAFDRFCTSIEQRFTQAQIGDMLRAAGFDDIRFSDKEPFWVAVAIKRR